MDDLDPRIDALYAGPPALFTKARDALAREMAAEGDRAGAAAARALRRPSALAAELNRLARVDPARMDALMEAQDALAGAQRRVLDGSGDATALRAAERAESDAVGAFPGGPPVHAALRFAARSPAMRDELRRGALSRDPAPSDDGEGPFSLGPAAAPRATAAPAPPRDELAEARAKRAARQAGSAPGDGAGPAAEATSAADEAARAAREAERAVTLRAVTAALDETRTAERAALAARDAARPRAEEAAVAADRAGGDRERLRRELAGAEERVDAAERERADAKAALAAAQAAAEEARVERERAERAAREALEEASRD